MKKFQKLKPSQSGFAAVEAILVLVIVGILGFTGYFVWHARQSANQSLDQAAKVSEQKGTASEHPDTTEQKIEDSHIAAEFVQKTYKTYIASLSKTNNISTAVGAIKHNISDNLYVVLVGKSGGADPVLCNEGISIPDSVEVTSVIPSVTVIGTSVDTHRTDRATIQANYDIRTHKITDIICP